MAVDTFAFSVSHMSIKDLFSCRGFAQKSFQIAAYNFYTAELKSHCPSKMYEEY